MLQFLIDSIPEYAPKAVDGVAYSPIRMHGADAEQPPVSSILAAWAAADQQLAETLRAEARPSSIGSLLAHPLSHHYFRQFISSSLVHFQSIPWVCLQLWTALQPTASLVLILLQHSKRVLPTLTDVPALASQLLDSISATTAVHEGALEHVSSDAVSHTTPETSTLSVVSTDDCGGGIVEASSFRWSCELRASLLDLCEPSRPNPAASMNSDYTGSQCSVSALSEEPIPVATSVNGAPAIRRACEQYLASMVESFVTSDEYRTLSANLGAKSMSVVASAMATKAVNLSEGAITAGCRSDNTIRMVDGSIRPMHLRIHTGAVSTVAEHIGPAGGTFLRGRRVRLTLLLPEDTLWLGLSGSKSGLQYRVRGLCSIESRSNASTGGASVPLEPGARGLGQSIKLPQSPGPIEPPTLLRGRLARTSSSIGAFRLQLTRQ